MSGYLHDPEERTKPTWSDARSYLRASRVGNMHERDGDLLEVVAIDRMHGHVMLRAGLCGEPVRVEADEAMRLPLVAWVLDPEEAKRCNPEDSQREVVLERDR